MNKTVLLDLLSNKDVWTSYQILNKSQWYSEDEMRHYQLQKLRKLISHCHSNVPFYSKIISKNHVDINNINDFDILKQFPIINKDIINKNYNEFIPMNLSTIHNVKSSKTGGTTGNIIVKRNDSATRSVIWGSMKRFYDWMGIKDNDRTLTFMASHVYKSSIYNDIKKTIIDLFLLNKTFSPYRMLDTEKKEVQEYLLTKKPALIRAYSQALYEIAKDFESKGLKFNLKAVTTTAEPLLKHHRDLFQKVFNCETFDQYGCGEIGGIAYECNHHEGLHITEERVIVENLDNSTVFTDLDNLAMPFIRYQNGDELNISNSLCSCGRRSKLIKSVTGRTSDYILGINNNKMHWGYFWHLFYDTNIASERNLIKFQVIQESLERIRFEVVADEFNMEDKKMLELNMRKFLGDMVIEIKNVNDIPPSISGKHKAVINRLIQ